MKDAARRAPETGRFKVKQIGSDLMSRFTGLVPSRKQVPDTDDYELI